MQRPDDERLRRALDAIRSTHGASGDPRDAWMETEGPLEQVHVVLEEPGGIAAGQPYVTWVVTFRRGEPLEVVPVRSVACSPR